MAAPHVSGIIGLLRSVNPLVSGQEVVSFMKAHPQASAPLGDDVGGGVPNAFETAARMLGYRPGPAGQMLNRMTPMFVLRNAADGDRLYTAKPQVAIGAGTGELLAEPPGANNGFDTLRPYFEVSYNEANLVMNGSYGWPSNIIGLPQPRASFYVFTTPASPFSGGNLVPLSRLSFAEPCDWRDHVYSTAASDVNFFESTDFCSSAGSQHYEYEGIEGYILATCPPEFGTCDNFTDPSVPQALYRKYSYKDETYALVLASQISNPVFSSYTHEVNGVNILGYVFPNVDTDSDGLIDGIERMIGTNRFSGDSDGDGVSDLSEYPMQTVQE